MDLVCVTRCGAACRQDGAKEVSLPLSLMSFFA